jgi:chemotaxis protein MotB
MLRSRKKNHPGEGEAQGRDRWLLSYADLVTLLLALFIVLYASSDKERATVIAASFSAQNTGGTGVLPGSDSEKKSESDGLDQKMLQNPMLIQKTKMRQTKTGLVISLSEAGFFASGDAAVNPEAEAVIKTIAESIKDTPAQVRIEGHTDSTPISTGRYPSNWELSTARASSVLAKLIDLGVTPANLSAAGYAGFQPIADNVTPEGRGQNRRVDVVIINR